MIIERDIDSAALYEQARIGLLDLVASLTDAQLATMVPGSPEWSVLDVLAHVIGINADLNAGQLGGDAEAWTAAQVTSRRGRSVPELRDEWDEEAPRFEEGLRLFGYELGSHFLGDLLQHDCDIRHALGLPRIPDDQALLVALDFYLDSFDRDLRDGELGSVVVRPDDAHWTLGAGEVVATWAADRYEVFRSLGGRRDEAQIRACNWTGDVNRIIGHVSRYGVPAVGLIEP